MTLALPSRQAVLDAAARFLVALRPFATRWRKELLVVLAMLLTLVAPFLLRPAQSTAPSKYDRRLVIMTPHHDRIRDEFAQAFAAHWKKKTGEILFIDWRVPGGTSDIAMFLKSEYAAAFQNHWVNKLGKPWTPEVAGAFHNHRIALPADPKVARTPIQEAREEFLNSSVGIGVDLFFGGGAYDYILQADAGVLVASGGQTHAGLAMLKARHPQWFSDEVIPEVAGGEPYRDKDFRWVGTCLSSFGIVFNRDVLRRLGIEKEPSQWEDLADPKLMGQVALADPTKSGSVTKAFEMIIQQQMQKEIDALKTNSGRIRTPAETEMEGVKRGWESGLQLIQRITANARYFTDSSAKIPLEVARGDAAAGMSIDFYGRSAEEDVRRADGTSRVGFVTPVGGTSIGVDPIGLMRGAPDPELAMGFMEFVLGDEGQKLWSYRAKVPGGPTRSALRRLPVRKDFYSPQNTPLMSDANEKPYETAQEFVYHPEWTGPMFNSIRFLIRVTCIDVHQEQQKAWAALVEAGMPERATTVFHDTKLISYETTKSSINTILSSRDKVQEVRLARKLSDLFCRQYENAIRFARAAH